MTFAEAIIQVAIQLSPSLVVLGTIFIISTWLRLIVDKMSARGF